MRLPLLIFLFVWAVSLKAQVNLVPNPSFEDTVSCPDNDNQLERANGWWAARVTPDYYNSCSHPYLWGVPYNWFGMQYAASGNAYAGFFNFTDQEIVAREILGVMLLHTLVIGKKYSVGFSVSLSEEHNMASNNMGMLFSNNIYESDNLESPSEEAPVNNYAHFKNDSIVYYNSTANYWINISGNFIADSAYQYLYIGNFYDNEHTDSYITGNPMYDSFYYIDDVFVIEDTSTTAIPETEKPKLKIFPNPAGNQITIEQFGVHSSELVVEVYDAVGRLVYGPFDYAQGDKRKMTIDVSGFSKGVYLLRVKEKEEVVFWEKLIIE